MEIGRIGTIGMGIKKKAPKKKAQKKGKGLLSGQELTIQKRPTVKHSVVKPKFHKDMSH